MAHFYENSKKFKVIKMSYSEAIAIWWKYGGCGICDCCLAKKVDGYYVAVLNYYMCPKCFERWFKKAIHYPEDFYFETKSFAETKDLLVQAKLWEE